MGAGKKILAGYGIGCAVVIVAGIVLLIGLGMAVEQGYLPDTAIVSGKSLKQKHREVAQSITPFERGESLRWLYSAGFLRYEADLQFMTDRRLVVAWLDGEEVKSAQLRLEDIRHVDVIVAASGFQNGVVQVSGAGDVEPLQVTLSDTDGRDEWVIEQLRKHVPPAAAEAGDDGAAEAEPPDAGAALAPAEAVQQ